MLTEHKENFLIINCKQSVKVEDGTIEFENYFKQRPVPCKVYAEFECTLKDVKSCEGSYSKKYQDHIPFSLDYKVASLDDKFSKQIVAFRGENSAYKFIKAILTEYE